MATGLFGTGIGAQSDGDIVSKIRQEQQLSNQQLTQNLGKYAGLAASGMGTAQQFQSDVGKLFGIQDPRLQKNSLLREAGDAVKARGVDMSDALATLKAFSEELMKRGLYQEATALVPQIQQAQRQAAGDVLDQKRLGLEEQRVRLAGEQLQETKRATGVRETQQAQEAQAKREYQQAELALRKAEEARQGKLTEAQIQRTLAEIRALDQNKYAISPGTDINGNLVITAINKTNPSDVKVITPGGTPKPPTPAGKVDKKDREPLENMYVTPIAP